jgi:drug/metabolite transporter (DMT)-like permease
MLALGLLSTGLAYIIFFGLLASAGSTNLSLVTLLVPVSAQILGALALGEPITLRALAGMALIAAGLALIDGRLVRRARSPSPSA